MSIDHKAYLFDYRSFDGELVAILYAALQKKYVLRLRMFILSHLTELTDQGTEEPPGMDWEHHFHTNGRANVQRYADLALTKYYDCRENLGLSYGFDALHAYLRTVPAVREHADDLICGRLFGPKGRRLDPGLMGTGLLSFEEAHRLHQLLQDTDWPTIPGPQARVWENCHYKPETVADVYQSLTDLRELYRQAHEENKGLILVDFNDCGVSSL